MSLVSQTHTNLLAANVIQAQAVTSSNITTSTMTTSTITPTSGTVEVDGNLDAFNANFNEVTTESYLRTRTGRLELLTQVNPSSSQQDVALTMGTVGVGPEIRFGSGVPTQVSPVGSLYLNTSPADDTQRLYVCTDASPTWKSVTINP